MSIADALITRGWYQGDFEGPDGSVRIAGAILVAQGATRIEEFCQSDDYDARRDLSMCCLIEDLAGIRRGGIAAWNDALGRSFDEVLRVAKEADAILDQ